MRVKDGKASGKGKAVPKGKEIVRRELKSVLTGGTLVDGSMLTDDLASHCVAIKVSSALRRDSRVGLTWVDRNLLQHPLPPQLSEFVFWMLPLLNSHFPPSRMIPVAHSSKP